MLSRHRPSSQLAHRVQGLLGFGLEQFNTFTVLCIQHRCFSYTSTAQKPMAPSPHSSRAQLQQYASSVSVLRLATKPLLSRVHTPITKAHSFVCSARSPLYTPSAHT